MKALGHRNCRTALIVIAITVIGDSDAIACSGPHAAEHMRQAALFGAGAVVLTIAVTVAGAKILRRQRMETRIIKVAWLPVLHPCWWTSVSHGDCGRGLIAASLIGTPFIGLLVSLVVCWPSGSGRPQRWRWVSSGTLIGALLGLFCAWLLFTTGIAEGSAALILVGYSLLVMPLTGAGIGNELYRARPFCWSRPQLSLRFLLLLPLALVPLFVVLFPVIPYQASTSSTAPFYFLVIDDATGQPVPGAAVRVIDPRHRLDDPDWQSATKTTGPDGRAGYFLHADCFGRRGLLGEWGTTTFSPQLLQVEAPGYSRFLTVLSDSDPETGDRPTAPPLGLTFPPSGSVTIRLKPIQAKGGR